jgi:hypothetical protein
MKFNLTTDDTFTRKGQKIKVLTAGIDVSEFIDNPLMLAEHKSERILGTWKDITVMSDRIIAEPNFDDDNFSKVIEAKVNKGTIKSASVGIEVKDAYLDGDTIVISNSVLLEASLVGLPQNKKAKAVQLGNRTATMLLSEGAICDVNKLFENLKLKNMTNTNEITTTPIENVVEETIVTEATEAVEEVIEEVKEEVIEETVELANNDVVTETKEVVENVQSLVNETLQLEYNKLNEDYLNLSKQIEAKDLLISELQAKVDAMLEDKKELILNKAIEEGKITIEGKVAFKDLSVEKIEDIVSKLKASNVSLSNTISNLQNNSGNTKTYEWYLKYDKDGLRQLSNSNPSLYKQLEEEYINKINKK